MAAFLQRLETTEQFLKKQNKNKGPQENIFSFERVCVLSMLGKKVIEEKAAVSKSLDLSISQWG